MWVEAAVADFGRALGLTNWGLDGGGRAGAQIGGLGLLLAERVPDGLRLSLVRKPPRLTPALMTRALTLCHPPYSREVPVWPGLTADDDLVFGVVLPERTVTATALETSLETLRRLHDAAGEAA